MAQFLFPRSKWKWNLTEVRRFPHDLWALKLLFWRRFRVVTLELCIHSRWGDSPTLFSNQQNGEMAWKCPAYSNFQPSGSEHIKASPLYDHQWPPLSDRKGRLPVPHLAHAKHGKFLSDQMGLGRPKKLLTPKGKRESVWALCIRNQESCST